MRRGYYLEVSNLLETAQQKGGKDGLGENVVVVPSVIVSAEVEECSVVIRLVFLLILQTKLGIMIRQLLRILDEEIHGFLTDCSEGKKQQGKFLDSSFFEDMS